MDKNTIVSIAPTFRLQWEEVQNCYVILYPEGMVKLSTSAGEIMQQVNGTDSVSVMIENLAKKFPEQGDLSSDVIKFLEVAHGNGWLTIKT